MDILRSTTRTLEKKSTSMWVSLHAPSLNTPIIPSDREQRTRRSAYFIRHAGTGFGSWPPCRLKPFQLVCATNNQPSPPKLNDCVVDEDKKVLMKGRESGDQAWDLGWLPSFPHVLTASMTSFLFGYHIGVMNGPIISIARELGFEGNAILEGLVVSIFITGAFIGSLSSGAIVDKLGCRRTLQLSTLPLIIGAIMSAQAHSLDEILLGRFLVGIGIGVNTVLVPIYISEVAPTRYRGSLGTLCQVGTYLGIIASLWLAISSENDPHWWRIMFYIAAVPGFLVASGMQFAVDSPRWLCKTRKKKTSYW